MSVHHRRHSRIVIVLLVLTMLAGSALVAYAAATFGTIVNPTFDGTNYVGTVEVTAISNPDKQACIEYSVNGGTAVATPCSCVTPDCDPATALGTWVCTIPGPITSSTVEWRMGTWSAGGGNSCGSEKTLADSGAFGTTETAVTLADLQSTEASGGVVSAVVGLLLILTSAAVLWRKQTA